MCESLSCSSMCSGVNQSRGNRIFCCQRHHQKTAHARIWCPVHHTHLTPVLPISVPANLPANCSNKRSAGQTRGCTCVSFKQGCAVNTTPSGIQFAAYWPSHSASYARVYFRPGSLPYPFNSTKQRRAGECERRGRVTWGKHVGWKGGEGGRAEGSEGGT